MLERYWKEIVWKINKIIALETAEWRKAKEFETSWRNLSEKLMLVMSEVSEASDEAEAICKILDHGCVVREVKGKSRSFEELEKNEKELIDKHRAYVEEWIDAMVRCMDIIGSLFPGVEYCWKSETTDVLEFFVVVADSELCLEVSWRDAFGPGMAACSLAMLAYCSRAMEAYRDIVLDENGVPEKINNLPYTIFDNLCHAVDCCIEAINMVGIDWRSEYARKMDKNEQRPVKHGRQR